MTLDERCTEIADRVVPQYRKMDLTYSCTGHWAKRWQAAWDAACVALDIPFIAAVPFEGQERRWPEESQARYRRLLAAAHRVEIISPFPGARAMQIRNEWMVDRADHVVALWDGSWGDTFNCVEYARKRRVEITNLWDRWTMPPELRDLL